MCASHPYMGDPKPRVWVLGHVQLGLLAPSPDLLPCVLLFSQTGSFQLPKPREATLGSPISSCSPALTLSPAHRLPGVELAKASFLRLKKSGPPCRQGSHAGLVRAFQGHLAQICHFSERQVEPQRRGEIFQGHVARDSCRPRPKCPDSKASAPWATATCLLQERGGLGSDSPFLL